MKNKNLIYAAVLFQCLIIVGLFVKAFYPLLTGEEVVLKTIPYDPRDMFRGNYAVLNYDFNSLDLKQMPNDLDTLSSYTFGDVFFLELSKKGDYHEPTGIWTKQPEGKIAMRVFFESGYEKSLRIKTGIDSYFTNPVNAKEIEKKIQNNNDSLTTAVSVMIAKNGQSRIKELNFRYLK
jgi:uncharacterized membrane-anchored protein